MNLATEVKTTGWVGFGFAKKKSSNMEDYDVCIGYVSGSSKVLKDYLTDGHETPEEDSQNDCILTSASETGGTTTLQFQRKVITEDSADLPIESGDILVVWAYRNIDTLGYHSERGFKTLTMISSAVDGSTAGKWTRHHWSLVAAFLCIVLAVLF